MSRSIKSWRDLSHDPIDPVVRRYLQETLLGLHRGRLGHVNEYLVEFVRGNDVLDIGVVAHTIARSDDLEWRHGFAPAALCESS